MLFVGESFFAAASVQSGYEKWNLIEPGVFLFYLLYRKIPKKKKKKKKKKNTVAGVAHKQSRHIFPYVIL